MTVTVVVVFMVMVVSVVMSGGIVVIMGLVYCVAFLAVCRFG